MQIVIFGNDRYLKSYSFQPDLLIYAAGDFVRSDKTVNPGFPANWEGNRCTI
jgi:hypothetical protein